MQLDRSDRIADKLLGNDLNNRCGRVMADNIAYELVSKELNHFGEIAGCVRKVGGHSSGYGL